MELFGVGAAEAFVVLVITLIVVGPQRFPEIARQGGRYYRMARRYAAEVTADVRGAMEELEAEVTHQQDEFKAAGDDIASSISSSLNKTREELEDAGRETQALLSESAAPLTNEPASPNGSGGLIAPRELSTSEVDDDEGAGRGTRDN